MIRNSHAKINLSLEILKKRDDDYHNITSIFQLLELHDEIEIIFDDCEKEIEIISDAPIPLDENNSCFKAVQIYKDNYFLPDNVKIIITKKIPVCAGLGGGSSNAATVLSMLIENYQTRISENKLLNLGLQIGADVPFFLKHTNTAHVGGIGDEIFPIKSLSDIPILLVVPNFGTSTKDAYDKADSCNLDNIGDKTTLLKQAIQMGFFREATRYMYNDFEKCLFPGNSKLPEIKSEIDSTSPIKSLLTGTGSVLYALYENDIQLENAYIKLSSKYNTIKSCFKKT